MKFEPEPGPQRTLHFVLSQVAKKLGVPPLAKVGLPRDHGKGNSINQKAVI